MLVGDHSNALSFARRRSVLSSRYHSFDGARFSLRPREKFREKTRLERVAGQGRELKQAKQLTYLLYLV